MYSQTKEALDVFVSIHNGYGHVFMQRLYYVGVCGGIDTFTAERFTNGSSLKTSIAENSAMLDELVEKDYLERNEYLAINTAKIAGYEMRYKVIDSDFIEFLRQMDNGIKVVN